MKKQFTILSIIVLLFFGGFQYVDATSGACSSHGGVDCSAGRQLSGTVYCNDGWADSMVQYDFMAMCQSQDPLAGLDPECVRQAVAIIRDRDEQLAQTDAEIDAYIKDMTAHDTSDPVEFQKAQSHLNYLYTLRGRINRQYMGYVVNSCKNYKAPKIQQTIPPPKSQCDNNYAYPTGQRVILPKYNLYSTVDPPCCSVDLVLNKNNQCVTKNQACKDDYGNSSIWSGRSNERGHIACDCMRGSNWNSKFTVCVVQPPTNSLSPVVQDKKPVIKKESEKPEQTTTVPSNDLFTIDPIQRLNSITTEEQKKSELFTIADSNNKSENPMDQNSFFPKLWSWFKDLFGR